MVRFLGLLGAAALLVLGTLTGAGVISVSPSSHSIVDGEVGDIAKTSFIGFKSSAEGQFLGCGLTLVSETKAIGAASCYPDPKEETFATFGRQNVLVETGDTVRVSKVFPHPDFDATTKKNDIAVLTLEKPVQDSSVVPLPILLFTDAELYDAGTKATVLGWGTTSDGGALSNQLLQAEVPLVADSACQTAFGQKFDPETMVCAGDGAKDACKGDTGGPLVADGKLIGIVSFGDGCAKADKFGVYTRITGVLEAVADELQSP
ncbi:serine protease [Pseudonocardiaceae bacterium YIM PH 21723]|nr:serine protease [Pseudonocardiaceae bacterium YIM PH 21723]